jgi:phosphohistidine swiveling domain-containing protein
MKRLPVDDIQYAPPPASALVEATIDSVRDIVRRRFTEWGGDWNSFVFGGSGALIIASDLQGVEDAILASGHRFDWSASISAGERPQAYKPMSDGDELAGFSFEHPGAQVAPAGPDGREQRGVGDNVVGYPKTVVGTARYIRSSARVLAYLNDGVPPGTIAIIDDSGGTLTAPIIEQFAGVVCAGGSVRSHLGILTREYGIPCLMNARVSGIHDGDRIELEVTAPAKTTEDYQAGVEKTGRIWRLAAGNVS